MEFFGLPGCGKTSLLYETAGLYGDRIDCYYPNLAKIEKTQGNIVKPSAFVLKKGKLLGIAVRMKNIKTLFNLLSLGLKSKNYSRVVLKLFLTMYLYFLNVESTMSRIDRGLVLSDNGFVQIMISILKRSRNSSLSYLDFFRILNRYNVTFNFIYLEISPELSRARIYDRGKALSVMQHGEEAALEQLASEFELFNRVYDEMNKRCNCYRLDSSQQIETVLDEITGILG